MTQIDMKMPYSCEDCKISRYDFDYDFAFCPFIRDGVTRFVNERHPKCPLKESKQGEWVYEPKLRLVDETDDGAIYETEMKCFCSACGADFGFRKVDDAFCKYCGADMRPREGDAE